MTHGCSPRIICGRDFPAATRIEPWAFVGDYGNPIYGQVATVDDNRVIVFHPACNLDCLAFSFLFLLCFSSECLFLSEKVSETIDMASDKNVHTI